MVELMLDNRVAIPESVIAREVDGETVLLNLDTGIYFGLDAVGTAIWRAIQEDGRLMDVGHWSMVIGNCVSSTNLQHPTSNDRPFTDSTP